VGLLSGLLFAVFVGNPRPAATAKFQQWLLPASVVGLGFGIKINAVLRAGATGIWVTALSLTLTIGLGWLLARWLRVGRVTGQLISTGTAVCGGSAIAAIGPVLNAQPQEMSVALGCVFILNAAALLIFPALGHWAHLSQLQFGTWAAIAIHDTSSVVGAAARFGPDALTTAISIKLARALWILPVVAVAALLCRRMRRDGAKTPVPWFVAYFLGASLMATLVPAPAAVWAGIVTAAKTGLTVTLFLIGAGLSRDVLRSVGWRPLVLATALWTIVSAAAFAGVCCWIK